MKAVSYEGIDCMENSILTIMNYELPDIHKAYFNTWNFHYIMDIRASIGKRIVFQNMIRTNFERFYGYKFVIHSGLEENEYRNLIKEQLKKKHPVIATCKANYCPWTIIYRTNIESPHVFIICGTNRRGFICMDTTPIQYNLEISYEEFFAGVNSICVYSKVEIEQQEELSERDFLLQSIKDDKSGNYRNRLDELEQFIEELSEIDIMQEFNNPGVIYATPLYRGLNQMYGGRQLYLEFLKIVTKPYEDKLQFWYQKFEEIVYHWATIHVLMMRLNDKKVDDNNIKDKIIKNLIVIKGLEETFRDNFFGQLMKPDFSWDSIYIGIKEREYTYIDLKPYFNNGDWLLSYPGFRFEEPFPFGKVYKSFELELKIEPKGELNSISCSGQQISVPPSTYDEINLAGYATYGQQFENLTLCFEDGTKANILFDFSDWSEGEWKKESTLWSTDCWIDDEVEKKKANVFTRKYEIVKNDSKITQIILPENNYISLLAISFAKIK